MMELTGGIISDAARSGSAGVDRDATSVSRPNRRQRIRILVVLSKFA
jgi:hypothetical protein